MNAEESAQHTDALAENTMLKKRIKEMDKYLDQVSETYNSNQETCVLMQKRANERVKKMAVDMWNQVRVEQEKLKNRIKYLEQRIEELEKENKRLVKILNDVTEDCPNPHCGNSGAYPIEPDGDAEQCEWCDTVKNSRYNLQKDMKIK